MVFVSFSHQFSEFFDLLFRVRSVYTTWKWARLFTHNFMGLFFLLNLSDIDWFLLVFYQKVCALVILLCYVIPKMLAYLQAVSGDKKANGWGVLPHTFGTTAPPTGKEDYSSLELLCVSLVAEVIASTGLLRNQDCREWKKETRNFTLWALAVLLPSSWTRTRRVLLDLSMSLNCWPLLDFSVCWDQVGVGDEESGE